MRKAGGPLVARHAWFHAGLAGTNCARTVSRDSLADEYENPNAPDDDSFLHRVELRLAVDDVELAFWR